MSDHNKWINIFKVLLNNNKKTPKQLEIQTDHFSQEIREFPEAYLIQQFWSSIPGHTSGGYMCTQVHSSDLFLTLVMPRLIQVCPLLARRGFTWMLWLQEFPLRTLSSTKTAHSKAKHINFLQCICHPFLWHPGFEHEPSPHHGCNWLCSLFRWTYTCFCPVICRLTTADL